jgi:hypothetical protein
MINTLTNDSKIVIQLLTTTLLLIVIVYISILYNAMQHICIT